MYRYDRPDNLVTLMEDSVAKFPDRPLFGTQNAAGEYEWLTYRETGRRIDNLRAGLAGLGVTAGDAVGVICNNRVEWAVAAFATFGLGGRFIPMYEKELAKTWKYIIQDGGVRVLFVANAAIRDQATPFMDEIPGLEAIYTMEGEGEGAMAALERVGESAPVPSIHPPHGDVAVLIYTSGTTGTPKGVLLSHGNFTTNFKDAGGLFPELAKDAVSISILPWAHSYGQTAELYNFIHYGGAIGFMRDVTTLGEDMGKVRPTFLIAVPRVFNKIYDGLWNKMNDTGGLARKLFVMGVESGKELRRCAEESREPGLMIKLKHRIADKVVFSKIRARFGGRLTGALTASATMNVEIGHFFTDIGIPVYDAYGLTETSPAVTMNCPAAHRPGSVGRPIDQVRVVIDKTYGDPVLGDGEIIVYGPNVMQGYHNKPDATREAMTDDGGFRTGDRGRLDEDGFLFITGRIKEQYKLENGKYVFPAALEEEIRLHPFVENAFVFGDGRAYNICLVVPDFEVLSRHIQKQGIGGRPEDLIQQAEFSDTVAAEIKTALKGKFGGYEIPRKFTFLTENFTLDNGLLTQTMKLKRRQVVEKFGEDIEALYAD